VLVGASVARSDEVGNNTRPLERYFSMRRPRPLRIVGGLFLVLPVLEIVGLIWVGHLIGFWWTLAAVLAGVGLGALIIQQTGRRTLMSMAASARRGQLPPQGLTQPLGMVAGGLLLMVPGFITDVAALAVMFAPTRRLITRAWRALVPTTFATTWVGSSTSVPRDAWNQDEPTVVRGDVL